MVSKLADGSSPLMPADLVVVIDRVHAARLRAGIGGEILVDREVSVRVAPLVLAAGVEMVERVHAGVEHIEIVTHVERGIEQCAAVFRRNGPVSELEMLDVGQGVGAVRP